MRCYKQAHELNPGGRIAGVDTGSFWTLRLYPTS
jgi:hypothetical protein